MGTNHLLELKVQHHSISCPSLIEGPAVIMRGISGQIVLSRWDVSAPWGQLTQVSQEI